jgi:predicted O-methyltransferase YrrM
MYSALQPYRQDEDDTTVSIVREAGISLRKSGASFVEKAAGGCNAKEVEAHHSNANPSDQAMTQQAATFHSWDAMAPAALAAIASRLRSKPIRASVETGCGGSTIVFSQVSALHVAFAIEGENQTISQLRARADFHNATVTFVEGETRDTIPAYRFEGEFDFILLDGPHAYPLPQVEFCYLFPHLSVGGWLALDDIQIPSVHELFRFLCAEKTVVLEEIVARTAFFRRVGVSNSGPDGWWDQGINRRTVFKYSWRDRIRKLWRRGGAA